MYHLGVGLQFLCLGQCGRVIMENGMEKAVENAMENEVMERVYIPKPYEPLTIATPT